jgi:hypothetical protein
MKRSPIDKMYVFFNAINKLGIIPKDCHYRTLNDLIRKYGA